MKPYKLVQVILLILIIIPLFIDCINLSKKTTYNCIILDKVFIQEYRTHYNYLILKTTNNYDFKLNVDEVTFSIYNVGDNITVNIQKYKFNNKIQNRFQYEKALICVLLVWLLYTFISYDDDSIFNKLNK